MRICIINDTHFGYKNSSQLFLDYQQKFFAEQFFPYCTDNGIDTIIHLGDLFHDRKHIGVKALHFMRTEFLGQIQQKGMHMHIIPGNHCVYYKNTIHLGSMFELLQQHPECVTIHMQPKTLDFDGMKFGIVPWMAAENHDECIDYIKTSDAPILGGHFEISGFKYIANSNMKSEGLKRSMFDRYEMVLSGHYHTKSSAGNITYLGSQYQFNWSDVDDKKYFHVLDTATRELIPIENKRKLYHKFYYDDAEAKELKDVVKGRLYSKNNIHNNYVRVIINKKTDYHLFDQYIAYIKEREPFDLTVVENFEDLFKNEDGEDESTEVIEDTSTLLDSYVDNDIHTSLDKNRIKSMLHTLYIEAQNSDSI